MTFFLWAAAGVVRAALVASQRDPKGAWKARRPEGVGERARLAVVLCGLSEWGEETLVGSE